MRNPDCPKCHGIGFYIHDHNHSTICDLCCDHDKGWWYLKKYYGKNNGKMCCLSGCGKTITWKQLTKMGESHRLYFVRPEENSPSFQVYYTRKYARGAARDMRKMYGAQVEVGVNEFAWKNRKR